MGDELLHVNYWDVFIYFVIFLIFILLKNSLFNKMNMVIFILYTLYYVFLGESYSDLFQVILVYAVVGIIHLSFCLAVNVFSKGKK